MKLEHKTKRGKNLAEFDRTHVMAIRRLRKSKKAYDAEPKSDASLAGAAYMLHEATWQEVVALETSLTCNFRTFQDLAHALKSPCEACCFTFRMKEQYGPKIDDCGWIRRFLLSALKTFRDLEPQVKNHESGAVQSRTESSIRKLALRLGYQIQKCRERSKDSLLRETYQIRTLCDGQIVSAGHCGSFGLTLRDCENFLSGERVFSFDDYELANDPYPHPNIPLSEW